MNKTNISSPNYIKISNVPLSKFDHSNIREMKHVLLCSFAKVRPAILLPQNSAAFPKPSEPKNEKLNHKLYPTVTYLGA